MKLFQNLPLAVAGLFVLFATAATAQDEAATGKGAIIIVSVEGDVKIKKVGQEAFLPKDNVAAGKTIFDGHTVITGDASKAVLLLSNGSITTVTQKSELTFQEFTQKAFEKSDTKMSELEGEPSNSSTKLKLGYGDMVFNVKKLNPGSSFEIDSPVGNAGIRGTDGQMSAHQDADGNFTGGVNMLSGSVVYTDPSGNQQDVPAGQGTTATTDPTGQQVGETESGEVPAETQQQMQETTNEAEESTGDITVSETAEAVSEANEAAASEETSSEESSEEESSEEESSEESSEETTEESSEESSEETTSEETSTEETATTEETTTTEETSTTETTEAAAATTTTESSDEAVQQNLETSDEVDIINETGEIVEVDSELATKIQALNLTTELKSRLQDYSEDMQWKVVELSGNDATFLMEMATTEEVLTRFFDYQDATRTDLLAMDQPTHALRIIEHPLSDNEISQALSFDLDTQGNLALEPTARLQTTLAMDLQENDLDELLGYSETLRADLVATDDATFVKTVVGREYTEDTLTSLVGDTRTTADILVGQELTDSAIELFYTYGQETRGKVVSDIQPAQVKSILSHNLADSQTSTVMSQTASTRDSMIEEPTDRLVGILAYSLTNAEADVLYKYSPELRQSFVDANDQALVKSLLALDQPETQAAAILASFVEKGEIVDQVDTEDKEPDTGDGGTDVVSDAITTLLEDSRANGNDHIVPILYEEGNGKIDDTLLAIGQLGNDLLTDVTVDGHLDSARFFTAQDAVMNLFYEEVALIFNTWVLPEYDDPVTALANAGQIFAARNLTIQAGTFDLDNHFSAGQTEFFLTASNEFQLSGEVNFTAAQKAEAGELALSLGAGGRFNFAENTKLTFLDGQLNLGSRETSEFVKVDMEAGGDISIASLESLVFQDSSLKVRAGDSIHLEAYYEISANGLQFSDQLKQVYMQAITVDLQNVLFPEGSMVYLQSQFGGIDGIYPTFPTGDPNNLLGNREFGRVNFIENVGYAETIINNRQTFDLFKEQILITPLGTPTQ